MSDFKKRPSDGPPSDPLSKSISNAAKQLRPICWPAARSHRVRAAIHRRRRRFALSTVALGSAAVAVAVAVAVVWFAQGNGRTVATEAPHLAVAEDKPRATQPEPTAIELRDGTRAVELGSASSLRLLHEDDAVVSFALDSGKGWFEVTPSRTRRVQVHIRDVHVEVLGTEFVVEVRGDIVHVWVHRGKVSVQSEGEVVTLSKGEHEEFPAENSEPASVATPDAGSESPLTQRLPRESQAAGQRDSEAVEDTPTIRRVVAEEPTVDELWRVADRARKRGRSGRAIRALTRLLNDHPDDERAALAAFSLGRVLLNSEQPAEAAARAFAKARKLSPDGPLVEDALLREVEAWHSAGDMRRVRSRTRKYLRLFPSGRYRKQLRDLEQEP